MMEDEIKYEKCDRRYFLWLSQKRMIGARTIRKLLQLFGGPKEVFCLDDHILEHLVEKNVIKRAAMDEIQKTRSGEWIDRYEESIRKKRAEYVSIADTDFPSRLKEIFDPPVVLYFKGDISLVEQPNLMGVVGSRTPSGYGYQMTEQFVREISKNEIVIVSGLAEGIDGAAHRNAIEAGGKTIGVIGGGIDTMYPQRNYDLYEEMERNHLILSEYGPGVPPAAYQFPLRNRIISGISDGVLVIEARKKSGTLITVDSALDQNKNVYAIPGRLNDALSDGTNNLIKQGATIVLSPEEIIRELKGEHTTTRSMEVKEDLGEDEKRLLDHMLTSFVTPDELIVRTGMALPSVLMGLFTLEQKGYIRQTEGGRFVKEMRKNG